jgi:hypothetical protein
MPVTFLAYIAYYFSYLMTFLQVHRVRSFDWKDDTEVMN